MKPKAAKEFNARSRLRVYVVELDVAGLLPEAKAEKTMCVMQRVSAMAREEGVAHEVQALSGGEKLDEMGVFLLKSPRRFVQRLQQMEDVLSVEAPSPRPKKKQVKKAASPKNAQ